MKKSTILIAVLMLMSAVIACSSTGILKDKMYIHEAKLTKDEESILNLVVSDKTPYILDFVVDDTIQSIQIKTYELQGSEWKLLYGGADAARPLNDSNNRIALTFDYIGLGLNIAIDNFGVTCYKRNLDYEDDGMSTTTAYLSNKTPIEYEKEIPLVIQIHTTKNEISSLSPEYGFYEPETYADLGFETVYAITCVFSQKTTNELSTLSE